MTTRIALVTGGTGGIGTAICKRLIKTGSRVVAGYLPAEEEVALEWKHATNDAGFDVELAAGDVTCYHSSESMVRQVEQRFGRMDILVNCAGITADQTLRKMEPHQWEQVIDTNLNGIFNVTRHVVEGMAGRNFGRIVNISSVNGQKGQFGQTNYSAAKAGVHGFTMALAQEVAGRGVTVNSVSPGYIDTQMTRAIPEEIRESMVAQIPVGRMGQPRDIALAVTFLCGEEAGYITGANLAVNGGIYMS
ncbi:MAG: acetoacetyl-CoA reductase [Gammaproteobacteria bacterium]|nr:acetoacetyl-CoA reductase [Gammaproteobacteria bacterium]